MEGPLSSNRIRFLSLAAFCAATPLLIPLEQFLLGGGLAAISLAAAWRDPDRSFFRKMGVLVGALVILAAAPINTDTGTGHFLGLGACFFAVIFLPWLVLRFTDPDTVRYRLFPRRFRWLDVGYVAISIPLSWIAFRIYFEWVSPEVPFNWTLPPAPDNESIRRLFLGVNLVGIWDELFFINTVYAVLRSMFSYRVANAAQAVVYTAVLFDMAFTGIGPVIIYIFALTQGAMFEESESLIYVIIVHLIVDAFLFAGILHAYYPGFRAFGGWH